MGVVIAAHNNFAPDSHRRLDRDIVSGRLWALAWATPSLRFWYSDDDGATWAMSATGLTDYGTHANLFVDVDGGLNVAYLNTIGGYLTVRRGTVNADATINWGTGYGQVGGTQRPHDLIAFRNPTAPGWVLWIAARNADDTNDHHMIRFNVGTDQSIIDYFQFAGAVALTGVTQGGTGFGGGIDFHHTGDGKTVAGGVADIYIALTTSYAITYYLMFPNGAIWPRYLRLIYGSVGNGYPLIAYDGTRVLLGYRTATTGVVGLYERDAGDTQTTNRGTSPALGASIDGLSMSYDRDGNVHFFCRSGTDADIYRVTWTRATATWDATWTLVVAAASGTYNVSSLRVGWAGARWPVVEGVYNDSTNLLYQLVLELNAAPSAPTITAPTDGSVQDVAAVLPIQWQFNDPDPGDAQSAYTLRRRIGAGAYAYRNTTGSWDSSESASTKITSPTSQVNLPATWAADSDDDHYYAVKAWDTLDQVSPWSTESRVVPSSKDDPTITVPNSDGYDVTTVRFAVEWTVATQSKYRLRVIGDASGTPDPTIIDYDSGITLSTTARSHEAQFPSNGVSRQIELTTWNDEGLLATVRYRRVDILYTPPATATLTINADDWVADAIVVTIENPGTGAAEDHNDLYRRVVGDGTNGIRIAADVDIDSGVTDYAVAHLVEYEYRVATYSTDGAVAWSAWEDGNP